MNRKLSILVTGASRGIGAAITEKICHRADNLFVTSKQQKNLENFINSLEKVYDNRITGFCVDQSNGSNASLNLSNMVSSKTNYLDAIILCAGDFIEGDLSNINSVDFYNTMNTNLFFNVFLIKQLLPLLKKGYNPKIIIIGSTAAYSNYEVPTYSVAKWGLRGYAINLRKELMEHGIGVTFISPGGTQTDMWADVDLPPNRLLVPSDIASIIDNLFELSPQAVVEEIIIRPMLGDVDN